MDKVIDEALAQRATEARKVLNTANTPGWKVIELSIVRMMQSLMPIVLQENDEAKEARAEVRAYQKVLNLLTQKVREAQATLAEAVKTEEMLDAQNKEAKSS